MAFESSPVLDVDEAVDSVERKLRALETCASKRLSKGNSLPALRPPRSFASARAMYYAIDSTVLRLEKTASELPRMATQGRSHIQATLIDYDPGELFYKRIEPPLSQVISAAQGIAKLTSEYGDACSVVLRQAQFLGDCARAEAVLISKAAKMAKPGDQKRLKQECETLVDASTDCSELKYDVNVRSQLHNHVMALSDMAAALGWVVSPAALKHVRDYKNIITNLTESILASYIDLGCNAVHSDFAEALNRVIEALADYVSKEHPAGLRWNYAQGATPLGYRRAERKVSANAHPLGDFYRLLHGPIAHYYSCSREFGGCVAKQAEHVVGAFTELGKAVEDASGKIRPTGTGGAELRMLLMSTQHELNGLEAVTKSAPVNYKYADHVNVVIEMMSVMQWCTATVNKMSPVAFCIDIQGVVSLYLDRLEMTHAGPTAKNELYVTRLHREWAQSIRDIMGELKDYVQTHHVNGLSFDTRRSRRSMDEINRRSSLAAELESVRNKSTSRKWRPGHVTLLREGRLQLFKGWERLGGARTM